MDFIGVLEGIVVPRPFADTQLRTRPFPCGSRTTERSPWAEKHARIAARDPYLDHDSIAITALAFADKPKGASPESPAAASGLFTLVMTFAQENSGQIRRAGERQAFWKGTRQRMPTARDAQCNAAQLLPHVDDAPREPPAHSPRHAGKKP